jgi:hypothetical protein
LIAPHRTASSASSALHHHQHHHHHHHHHHPVSGPTFIERPPHSAVLLRGSRSIGKPHTSALNVAIASHARNYRRVLYGDDERSIHAEARAVAHAVSAFAPTTKRGRRNADRRKRHSSATPNGILVVRFSRSNGAPLNSRPCADCVELLREAGLSFAVYFFDGLWHKESIALLSSTAQVSRTVLVAKAKRAAPPSSSASATSDDNNETTASSNSSSSSGNSSSSSSSNCCEHDDADDDDDDDEHFSHR